MLSWNVFLHLDSMHDDIQRDLARVAEAMQFQVLAVNLDLAAQWPCRRDRWWVLHLPRSWNQLGISTLGFVPPRLRLVVPVSNLGGSGLNRMKQIYSCLTLNLQPMQTHDMAPTKDCWSSLIVPIPSVTPIAAHSLGAHVSAVGRLFGNKFCCRKDGEAVSFNHLCMEMLGICILEWLPC